MPPSSLFERAARKQGHEIIVGIDEVGRGPWAGPVYAAAAIVDTRKIAKKGLSALDDSKKLTAEAREELFERLKEGAIVGVGWASVEEIDKLNILWASMLAMQRAVAALPVVPQYALVDGNRAPELPCPCETIVEGDARSFSIAAASVVAKVTRDRIMVELAREYPEYRWESNKGYGTPDHRDALRRLGVTPHHRRSWYPVFNRLNQLTLDLRDVVEPDAGLAT
jgi:ribonuclease HII